MKSVICQRCGNEFGTTCTRGDVKWCPDCRPIVAQKQRLERYRANFIPAPGRPDDNHTLGGYGWNCLALAVIKLAVADMRGECCENNRPPFHVMAEAALWLKTTGADWMRVLEGDDAADALARMAKEQLKILEAEWRTF